MMELLMWSAVYAHVQQNVYVPFFVFAGIHTTEEQIASTKDKDVIYRCRLLVEDIIYSTMPIIFFFHVLAE